MSELLSNSSALNLFTKPLGLGKRDRKDMINQVVPALAETLSQKKSVQGVTGTEWSATLQDSRDFQESGLKSVFAKNNLGDMEVIWKDTNNNNLLDKDEKSKITISKSGGQEWSAYPYVNVNNGITWIPGSPTSSLRGKGLVETQDSPSGTVQLSEWRESNWARRHIESKSYDMNAQEIQAVVKIGQEITQQHLKDNPQP